jgi:hypothetical protein
MNFPAAQRTAQHLTEAELDSCLIGDAAPEAAAHLSVCDPCRAALAEMEAPLASFRAVTLAWSERRSATLPLDNLAAARRRAASGWRQRAAVSAGLAAAMAVGVAIPVFHHVRSSEPQTQTQTAQSQPVAQPTLPTDSQANLPAPAATETASLKQQESPAQQIRRDNQMLRAIDLELDSRMVSPSALGLQPVSVGSQSVPSQMQD